MKRTALNLGLCALLWLLAELYGFVGLYDRFPRSDAFFHLTGGFLIANLFSHKKPLDILAYTALVAVIWEVYEFVRFFDKPMGYADTISDLVLGLSGAIFYIFLKYVTKKILSKNRSNCLY